MRYSADGTRYEAERFEARAAALTLENSQLRARLREVVALMEMDIECECITPGETRKEILRQSRDLVPRIK